jgi:hypothetical protein
LQPPRAVPTAKGGRSERELVVGDAPVRRHAAAQPNLCALAAPPQSTRLPPLVVAGPRSYLPNRGLPGVEPEQPNLPKMTASATNPTLRPRCRSRPATLPPPQDAYQLLLCRATGAISPPLPISGHPRPPAARPSPAPLRPRGAAASAVHARVRRLPRLPGYTGTHKYCSQEDSQFSQDVQYTYGTGYGTAFIVY